ncbi:hypothetical protein ACFVYV_53830 [Streptomyces mirabilis]|uniref:hypothetical protein n=1 Tax=Streptomyces mirabilis TaxID=68239 RepID=UPI0036D8F351
MLVRQAMSGGGETGEFGRPQAIRSALPYLARLAADTRVSNDLASKGKTLQIA